MSKTILENYLFLLTEDPEMDALDQEYKSSRAKLLKLGSGPEGHDALSSKYMNTPSDKIPPEHRQKCQTSEKLKMNLKKLVIKEHSTLNGLEMAAKDQNLGNMKRH